MSGGELDTLPIDDNFEIPNTEGMPPSPMILPSVTLQQEPSTTPAQKDGMVLRIPDRSSLEVPLADLKDELSQDFTLEIWLWLEHNNTQTLLAADQGLRLSVESGVLFGEVGGLRLTGRPLVEHEWYHVAVVVEGEEARLYVNGSFQDREFLTAGWQRPTGTLVVGYRVDDARSFIGQADNLRLVSSPIYTQQQFSPTNRLEPVDNTAFGFSFDAEAPGGKVFDEGGPGKVTGQLTGGAGLTSGHI